MDIGDQNEICESLCGFIQANLVADGVRVEGDTSLTKLGLDSFSIIEIVLFVERQYGLTLPDEALSQENIQSASTIAKCVQQYLQASQ